MPNILIVNDDGIFSPGLRALLPKLCPRYTCTIAAPSTQQSWIGKASSYHKSIPYKEVLVEGHPGFSITGSPADCASAGIHHLCSSPPDLVVSGINAGANVGDAYILSSGTIGGAIEGAIAGIPALAVGVEFSADITKKIEFNPDGEDTCFFHFAADLTAKVCRALFALPDFPPGYILNMNMDNSCTEKSELIFSRPARYDYKGFLRKNGNAFYHQGAPKDLFRAFKGTDMAVLKQGNIPLSLIPLPGAEALSGDWTERFMRLLS